MRSFSDINALITLMLVVALCALLNLNTTYVILDRVCEAVLSFLQQAAALADGIV